MKKRDKKRRRREKKLEQRKRRQERRVQAVMKKLGNVPKRPLSWIDSEIGEEFGTLFGKPVTFTGTWNP